MLLFFALSNCKNDLYNLADAIEAQCAPLCEERQCGEDGCGGTCGECPSDHLCSEGECRCLYWEEFFDDIEIYSVDQNFDGSLIIAGTTYLEEEGLFRPVLMKLDSTGKVLWKRIYKIAGIASFYKAIETSDYGFIAFAKSYKSPPDKACCSDPESLFCICADALAAKLDRQGNLEWSKSFGAEYNDYLLDIHETEDKGFVFFGVKDERNFTLSTPYEINMVEGDLWVFKLSLEGNLEWEQVYGGEENCSWYYMTKRGYDEGFIVAGVVYCRSAVAPYVQTKFFNVLKMNIDGDIVWEQEAEINTQMWHPRLFITSNKELLIAYSKYVPEKGREVFISKFNDWLDKEWEISFGGKFDDYPEEIAETTNGDFVLGSEIESDRFSSNDSRRDILITKLSGDGSIIWENALGGCGDESINDLILAENGDIIFSGYSSIPGKGVNGYKIYKRNHKCESDCKQMCGNDLCDNLESPATCADDCPCLPDCSGKDCGSDGCGGKCGGCLFNETCKGQKCVYCPLWERVYKTDDIGVITSIANKGAQGSFVAAGLAISKESDIVNVRVLKFTEFGGIFNDKIFEDKSYFATSITPAHDSGFLITGTEPYSDNNGCHLLRVDYSFQEK